MKICSFILCNGIETVMNSQGGTMSALMGPQVLLQPEFIPTNFSFGFSVGFIGIDLTQENQIKFRIMSPNNEMVMESRNSLIPINATEDSIPKEYRGFNMTTDVRNMVIKMEGIYTLEFFVNDELAGTQEVPIYKKVL